MRKLSLNWPSRPPASATITTAATIQTPMNHQRWRTARRPRRSRNPDTVAPLVGAHADTDSLVFRRTLGTRLIRNSPGRPCDHGPVPVEFVGRSRRAAGCSASRRRVHLGDVDAVGPLRLEALARYLQDVATDDADDAGLSERRRGLGAPLERPRDRRARPCTTKRSSWRRSAAASVRAGPNGARRVVGERGARVDAAALWVFVDRDARPTARARRRLPRPLRRVGRRASRARSAACTTRRRPTRRGGRGRCARATSTCSTT